jgi:hypothetical protein
MPKIQLLVAGVEKDTDRLGLTLAIGEIPTLDVDIPTSGPSTMGRGDEVILYVNDVQRFRGNVIGFTENPDGTYSLKAVAKPMLFTLKQFYTATDYGPVDAGSLLKTLLAGFTWAKTNTISTSIGDISIRLDGCDYYDAINQICECYNKIHWWDMETEEYRVETSGALSSGVILPPAATSEIVWETDATEVFNQGVIQGQGGLQATFSNAASQALWGIRMMRTEKLQNIAVQATLDLAAAYYSAAYADQKVTGKMAGVPYDENAKPGYTLTVNGSTHDGTYIIQRVAINFVDWLMDLELSTAAGTFVDEVKSYDRRLRLLEEYAKARG